MKLINIKHSHKYFTVSGDMTFSELSEIVSDSEVDIKYYQIIHIPDNPVRIGIVENDDDIDTTCSSCKDS